MVRVPSWIYILLGLGIATLIVYVLDQEGALRYWGWNLFQAIVLWFLIFILAMVLMTFDVVWDMRARK